MSGSFNYKFALVGRKLPSTLVDGISLKEHEPVDLAKANESFAKYKSYLQEGGLQLIEFECDDSFPDSCFVEDIAVAVKNRIFLTNPGAAERRDEVETVRRRLNEVATELNLEIVECDNRRDEAIIDGGDVCDTGFELIVGLSVRTNKKGAEQLQSAFPDIDVMTCQVPADKLHFKSMITMLCPGVFLMESTPAAREARDLILVKSRYTEHYRFIEMSQTANLITFNNNAIHSTKMIDFEKLEEVHKFKSARSLDIGEFDKIDGCLTCLSVLFGRD